MRGQGELKRLGAFLFGKKLKKAAKHRATKVELFVFCP
jgi:hypothetical protein